MPNNTDQEVKPWDLPYVEAAKQAESGKTNAYNRRSDWKYEPPEEVEEILPPTAEEIAEIRDAAFKEGFAEGKQEGLAKGLEEGQKTGFEQGEREGKEAGVSQGLEAAKEQVQEQLEILGSLIEHIQEPLKQVDNRMQKELVKLSTLLARSVIKTEVKINQDIILQALNEGLKVLPIQEQSYQISLHPDDLAIIKAHYDDQQLDTNNWQLLESPSLARGGCDIVTSSNAVDVTLEQRIRNVIDKFLVEQGL